jgi:hypothetical protein
LQPKLSKETSHGGESLRSPVRRARRGRSCGLELWWQNITAADERRREPKLQRLPERASASPRRPKGAPSYLLAAKAGQVDRSCRRVAGEAVVALEKEDGAAKPARSPFSSPTRPTRRGEESGTDTAGVPPAPHTRADEELQLPPDPPDTRLLPLLPSPPRPAGERRGKTGGAGAREHQAAKKLLEEVVVTPSTLSSGQTSQRAATANPTVQISPGSGQPRPGRAPILWHEGQHLHLHLDTTEGPTPILRLPPSATPARSALDRPGALSATLKVL